MMTEAHKKYWRSIFPELGVNSNFYQKFVKPTIRKIKKNKCEECSGQVWLDIHHASKELINVDTLLLLCKKCHVKRHFK